MVFSKALVRLFYQRGAFTGADTYLVSWVQICYSFQVPFYVLGALLVRFLSSVRRNDVVLWVAAVNLVLDIVLNLVLMRWWGIAGIAMSSSLVCVVSLMVLGTWTIRFLARQHSTAQEQDLAPQTEMARSASGSPGHFAE
jgi:putative peptidoglycan lipid II flippase